MIDIEELKNENEELVYLGDSPEQYKDAIVGLTCDGNHVVLRLRQVCRLPCL